SAGSSLWTSLARFNFPSVFLGLGQCPFEVFDVLLGRNAANRLPDHIKREIIDFFETNARLAHVQLLAGFGPRILKPFRLSLRTINAHEVNRHMVLLRR